MIKMCGIALAGVLGLSACGQPQSDEPTQVSGEEVADKLDKAADQSGPVAREALTEAAQEAREQPSMAPVDQPGSFAQDAMQKAGNAEASTVTPKGGPSPKQ